MIALTVTLDLIQDKMSVLENAQHVRYADNLAVGGVPNGTDSGFPSVMIAMSSLGGNVVVGETSLALFLAAADALKAKYGDPRERI